MKPARLLQQTTQSTTSHPKIFDTHLSKMVVELLLALKPVIHSATNHTNSNFLKQKKIDFSDQKMLLYLNGS